MQSVTAKVNANIGKIFVIANIILKFADYTYFINMALADVIKALFGSKADRDYKAVKPMLNKILASYDEIDKLSADELRARSAKLRAYLRDVEKPFEDRIAEIKLELDKNIPVSEKEKLATESDKLVKDEDEAIEKALTEILPEALVLGNVLCQFRIALLILGNDTGNTLQCLHAIAHSRDRSSMLSTIFL